MLQSGPAGRVLTSPRRTTVRISKAAVSNGIAIAIIAAVLGLIVRANARGGTHALPGC